MPPSGSCDLRQLSVPSGQLRALALRTASAVSHVPAALADSDAELSPSTRRGSLCQYLFHLGSSLLTSVVMRGLFTSGEPSAIPSSQKL